MESEALKAVVENDQKISSVLRNFLGSWEN